MVVAVVALAVLTPLSLGRGRVPASDLDRLNAQAREAPASATASATASSAPTDAPTRVVVIGDSDTGGTSQGGNDAAGWPALLEERVPETEVQAITAAAAGYVARDPESGNTLLDVADKAPVQGASVVIVFGSRNDGPGIADAVSTAALSTFNLVLQRAPDTKLIVIGPFWPSATVPARVRNSRDVIEAAAAAVGATFVDPLTEGWFLSDPGLIGVDGVNPTDAGHTYLADQIEPVVREALGG